MLARAQLLAALMAGSRGIAVAGTHGKTTTTSMLASILEGAGLDPTYVIGGDLNETGSNARSGSSAIFLAEADESDGSFLLLDPEIAVVTNVEDDHLDFYRGGIEEIEAAFIEFCRRAALVVACADDAVARRVAARHPEVVWYGEGAGCDIRVDDVEIGRGDGRCRLLLAGRRGEVTTEVDLVLPVPGKQYLLNAAAAIAVAGRFGVAPEDAARALRGFAGVRRRWEALGTARGASSSTTTPTIPPRSRPPWPRRRAEDGGRVVAVFQPHRFTRTGSLWRGLGESLVGADVVVLTDVYAAGEEPVAGVTGKLVVDGPWWRRRRGNGWSTSPAATTWRRSWPVRSVAVTWS